MKVDALFLGRDFERAGGDTIIQNHSQSLWGKGINQAGGTITIIVMAAA
jgi:hypothetical protein